MSSVARLISNSSRQTRSQYCLKSSHDLGTGRMLIPYIRYRSMVRAGGTVVIGTFAADGPATCSGLPVARYGP